MGEEDHGIFRACGSVAKDPRGEAALEYWLKVKDCWLAGREWRPVLEGITVSEICDRFLQFKDQSLAKGAISQLTRSD